MKHTLYTLLVFAMGIACQNGKNTNDKTEKDFSDCLRPSQIYEADSVKAYLPRVKENHKTLAMEYFNNAGLYKEKAPDQYLYHLKRAITLDPDRKKYVLLAEELLQKKLFEESAQAYFTLAALFGPMDTNEMTQLLKAIFLTKEGSGQLPSKLHPYLATVEDEQLKEAARGIRSAIDTAGFSEARKIFYESVLLYMDGAGGNSTRKIKGASPAIFKKMLGIMPDLSKMKVYIQESTLTDFNYNQPKWHFDECVEGTEGCEYVFFQNSELFGKPTHYRDLLPITNNVNWEGKFIIHKTDRYIALVYTTDSSASGVPTYLRQIKHYLATYTPDGKLIDYRVVAQQVGETLSNAELQKDTVLTSHYLRKWREPYKMYEADNEVTETLFRYRERVLILPNGKLWAEPLGM